MGLIVEAALDSLSGQEFSGRLGEPAFVGERKVVLGAPPGRENEENEKFMALYLTPDGKSGLVRKVTKRDGDVSRPGFCDESSLYLVSVDDEGNIHVGKKLPIEGEEDLTKELSQLRSKSQKLLGREDPTIVVDDDGTVHLYCTYYYEEGSSEHTTHLVHAFGPDLEHLTMGGIVLDSAKEVTMMPVNRKGNYKGLRLPLYEGGMHKNGLDYSIIVGVRVAQANSLGEEWTPLDHLVVDPTEPYMPEWVRGHASPGPVILDLGNGFALMTINGRGPNTIVGEDVMFSPFEVGLGIYDYEKGVMVGISKSPIIKGNNDENVTFASYFDAAKSLLYVHVNDSQIEAIPLDKDGFIDYARNEDNFVKPYDFQEEQVSRRDTIAA